MKRIVRHALAALAAFVVFLVAAAAILTGTAAFALRAAPGDWSHRVELGPVGATLSVPALARVATHPLGMRALAGRSLATRFGRVRIAAGDTPSTLVLVCSPCTADAPALAARPVRLPRVEVTVGRGEASELLGTARVGAVHLRWMARLSGRGADVEADIADAALADIVAVFGSAVPESAQARIEGRGGAAMRIALPSGRYSVRPRLDGLAVSGLGTEVLAAATPTPACGRTPRARRSSAPYGTWLAKAVIAAEDQRFLEHPGYDVEEMAAAWSTEGPSASQRRGASTLSQQLAKLLYTGDERSLARKVRELLYAVELDRALGKARVLQLYLAVAPWGDGQCGGEAAALHYFGKHAAALAPAEAVWLAGLLRNPEMELARGARGDASGNARLVVIGEALRPMSRAHREALREELEHWVPPLPVLARRTPTSTALAAR
ncbi:MAG: biosynthetic peptidoglycan transglycosylase [Caldimonas sp.]